MIYNYRCSDEKCGKEDFEIRSIEEGPSHKVQCPKCGKPMKYDLGLRTQSIRIPEHMKAGTDAVSPTEMGNRMNRSRPSGRRRSLYAVGGV